MQVTVCPPDRYIAVDGRGLVFDFPADANLHALQWRDAAGTVELKVGGSRPATLAETMVFVDLFLDEAERLDAPPPPPPPVPLADQKTARIAIVKRLRDLKETQGFSYLGKVIDSDERSVQRITGAALAAQVIGAGFAIDWTCADNSTLALDQSAMLGMPAALALRANALHTHARSLKATIDAATDEVALAAVDIENGWPPA